MGYAEDLANLETRRAAVCAELAAMSTSKAGGLPNSDGTGLNIDHVGYRKSLLEELKQLDELIKQMRDSGEGPSVLESEIY